MKADDQLTSPLLRRLIFPLTLYGQCSQFLIIAESDRGRRWNRNLDCNRNHKLEISTAPTKAKSREPVYSQELIQNKIDRQRVKIQRVWQADSQTAMVDGVWS